MTSEIKNEVKHNLTEEQLKNVNEKIDKILLDFKADLKTILDIDRQNLLEMLIDNEKQKAIQETKADLRKRIKNLIDDINMRMESGEGFDGTCESCYPDGNQNCLNCALIYIRKQDLLKEVDG